MGEVKELRESSFSIEDLLLLFEDVNHLFEPRLKTRIADKAHVRSMGDYVKKVLGTGHILICHNEKEIEGFMMYYANDLETKRAYIPLLGIRSEYHGKGIAKNLLYETLNRVKQTSMNLIWVKTWVKNSHAINLYKKFGFEITAIDKQDIHLELKLNKELKF